MSGVDEIHIHLHLHTDNGVVLNAIHDQGETQMAAYNTITDLISAVNAEVDQAVALLTDLAAQLEGGVTAAEATTIIASLTDTAARLDAVTPDAGDPPVA